ncbi:MAG: sigma factor-like helix-turn-helix DNA-binding protein [bacterium]|nr:sigma factor-like helix-turn-helix DNA-binding protein [bacterium]
MYNPDFWEVQIDQTDLEQIPNEAGLWFENSEDRETRYVWEDKIKKLTPRIDSLITHALTQKQLEAMVLYFKWGKTQQEISEIMGISRRVVSQHLFGITRRGKSVGGAVKKLQKVCRLESIAIQN